MIVISILLRQIFAKRKPSANFIRQAVFPLRSRRYARSSAFWTSTSRPSGLPINRQDFFVHASVPQYSL